MHALCKSVNFFSSFIISFRHVCGGGRACDLQIPILVIGQMDCCPASFVRLISHFLQTGKMRGKPNDLVSPEPPCNFDEDFLSAAKFLMRMMMIVMFLTSH